MMTVTMAMAMMMRRRRRRRKRRSGERGKGGREGEEEDKRGCFSPSPSLCPPFRSHPPPLSVRWDEVIDTRLVENLNHETLNPKVDGFCYVWG